MGSPLSLTVQIMLSILTARDKSIARLRRGDGIVFSPAGSLPKAPEPINPSPTFLLKTKMNFDSVYTSGHQLITKSGDFVLQPSQLRTRDQEQLNWRCTTAVRPRPNSAARWGFGAVFTRVQLGCCIILRIFNGRACVLQNPE